MRATEIERHRPAPSLRSRSASRSLVLFAASSLTALFVLAVTYGPGMRADGTSPMAVDNLQSKRRVPDYDVNLSSFATRLPSVAQLQALESLKANLGDQSVTARWDKATGALDTLYDFASAPSSLEPEAAARAFLAANAALLGVSDPATLNLESNVEALGGNLLYFGQTYNGLPVSGRGIGVVMDGERRIKMVAGPYQPGLSLGAAPSLDGAAAVQAAQTDLARYHVEWASGVAEMLNPALDLLAAQLGPLASPHPELNVFPTSDGGRLAYTFFLFSRNPFGMFKYQIDAATGQVLYREDFARYQQLPLTGDVYPTHPAITQELKDQGRISVGPDGTPLGQLRVQLRNFDQTNVVTGLNGTLTGLHAHIENALADKLPFPQAAKGTWHFRIDDPANLEARTNERDHHGPAAEPAEHQDEVAQFFYINFLLEYIDHLHRAGDARHSRVGQGDFPDSYPNQSSPLIGNVHIPNVLAPPTNPQDPAFIDKLLGLDNAFSISASQTVAGQKIVVNPTSYGHGYLFNDLAIDFGVPFHEGMHSISSPIAGLEGSPEGGALNEGQADLWAYTAAENPELGSYVLNGSRFRDAVRAAGGNPDLRQWIRHADSGLSYSQLGTLGGGSFEVHRDGEIFAAAMWDVRELLMMVETGGSFKRPDPVTGALTVDASLGKETWERLFLGGIYVLGTFNPDTFVRARDAMIVADQSLYPSDPLNPDAPGLHRALIEQVFASRELGVNAAAPVGGRQTISTSVSAFTASQGRLAAPAGVAVLPASPTSARVSWQPVSGAVAYEVLKREIGKENNRQNAPVPGREYIDGDASTDGFLHVSYVKGDQTSYVDNGFIEGSFVARGLKNIVGSEYVVRALNVNANRQLGVSDNSAAAGIPTAVVDVTSRIQTAISNVSFANGKFEFDLTLKNLGAGAFDGTMYVPIEFRIVSVSNSTVTVGNADNGGKGTSADPAVFFFRPTLLTGQTSDARHFVFNDPNAQLFTFDAVITARLQVSPSQATRYQPEPGIDLSKFDIVNFTEVFTGIVPASDTGLQIAPGVTFVDVPFTSQAGAFAVTGNMTSTLGVDLDLELRDSANRVLSSSTSGTANETVSAAILPNRQYKYRVIGWAGAAQDFTIESKQSLLVPKASSGAGGGFTLTAPATSLTSLVRFTGNPLTGAVTVQVIN
ncbi:MAG TPA: M36 family metallopeptidase [Blastocatellia bacterium]|nr:M36 family metallopeptidase [Blastocatellia bacterium]